MISKNAFKNFDPLNGEPCEYHNMSLRYISQKARSILNQRTREQIDTALQTLDWMLRKGEQLGLSQYFANSKSTNNEEGYIFTPTTTLINYMPTYDISGQTNFPDAQWEEYFAALALGLIGSCESYARQTPDEFAYYYQRQPQPHEIDMLRYRYIGELAVEAMEAVCQAECLRNVYVEAENKAQEKISLRNSQAAIAKHSHTNKIKSDFITYRFNGNFQSDNDAARKFYQSLPDETKRLISESNHVEFLTKALRAHKKEVNSDK